jgi:predicted transcriptional regulator
MGDQSMNVSVNPNIHPMRVSTNDLLKYMWRKGVTRAFDLIRDFGYTPGGARHKLFMVRATGLIINDRRGEWVVTRKGEKRLVYIGVKL